MRKFWGAVVFMLTCMLTSGLAAADSGPLQVTVSASVPPACYVVVNKNNQITEILTNSQERVTPEVYYGDISPAHRGRLTADIYTKYLLLARNHHQVGIVYRFSPHSINENSSPVQDLAFKRPKHNFIRQLVLLKPVGSIFHG